MSHRKPSAAPRLRPFSVLSAAWRGTGPRPTLEGRFSTVFNEIRRCHRSAGACPPRSLSHRKPSAPPMSRPFSVLSAAWRGTGPRPTLEGRFSTVFNEIRRCHRSAGACPPRSLSRRKPSAVPMSRAFSVLSDAWRGTGPRPTGKGAILAWRGTGPRPTGKGRPRPL